MSPSSNCSSTFPRIAEDSEIDYIRIFGSQAQRGRSKKTLASAIFDLMANRAPDIGKQSRWKMLLNALSEAIEIEKVGVFVFIDEEITRPISRANPRTSVLITLDQLENLSERSRLEYSQRLDRSRDPVRCENGKPLPFSSGQKSFISMIAQICLHVENGSLVLIDEPESFMHPALITSFMSLFDTVLLGTGSRAVVATHSPYVVREIPRDHVRVFRFDDDQQVSVTKPILQTLGADIGEISFSVFGSKSLGHIIERIRMRGLVEIRSSIDQLKLELPSEAITYLLSTAK